MLRHIPGLQSLKAFDASARHLNFTRAAAELHVTPAAVNHQIKELRGKRKLEGIVVVDQATREEKVLDHDGVFVFVGVTPNTDLVKGSVETDGGGFILAEHMMSSMSGVFAAGDVRSGSTKQAASAAGEGASAALAIREYLRNLGE